MSDSSVSKQGPDRDCVFVARSDVVASSLGDELAILDLGTGEYFTLNETGAFLWSALASPKSEGDLRSALLGQFEVDEATARVEIAAFLSGLSQVGLLETVDG